MFEKIEKLGNKWWVILLLFAVPLFSSLFGALFGFSMFISHNARFYPYFYFYGNSLHSGDSFLWNPDNFSGFPIIMTQTGGYLSPIFYAILRFVPAIDAYHWLIFVSVLLAAYFSFLFFRKIGLSFWAAILGGIVYIYSQWVWVDDWTIANVLPFLPFLFLGLLKLEKGKKWFALILGVVLGHEIITGLFHYILETLFAVCLFSIFLAFADERYELKFSLGILRKKTGFIMGMIVALAIGALLGLVQIIPSLLLSSLTSRETIPHAEAVMNGIQWGDGFKLLFPYFDSPLIPASHEQFYIGIIPLFLLFFSFYVGYLRFRRRNPFGFFEFFLGLFAVSAALSLNNSWLFWLLHHIPPFTLLHHSFRWMFIGWFAASFLAGFAADYLAEHAPRTSVIWIRIVDWCIAVIAATSFIFTIVFGFFKDKILSVLFAYFDANLYSQTTGLPLEHYHKYIEKVVLETAGVVDISSPRFFVPLIFIMLSWLLIRRFFLGLISRHDFLRWSVMVVAINMVSVFLLLQNTYPREIMEKEPATVSFIKARGQEGRTFDFLKSFTQFEKIDVLSRRADLPVSFDAKFDFEMIFPNTNLLYDIESADMYDPLSTRRMSRILGILGSSLIWKGEQLQTQKMLPEEKARVFASRKNLLNFLGIRYITSAYELDRKKFDKIFSEKILPPYNIDLAIYENESARPLFYFADSLEIIPEDELAAFEKLKMIPAEGSGVFIECGRDVKIGFCVQGPTLNFDGKGELEVKTKKNTISILKTKSETPQFLVFSENNLPGWKAYVDNQEVSIYTVGSVYMGIGVPEREHEIKFEFTYRTIIEEFLNKYYDRTN